MQGLFCNPHTGEVSYEPDNGKRIIIDSEQFKNCILGYFLFTAGTKDKGEITVPVLNVPFKIKFQIIDPRFNKRKKEAIDDFNKAAKEFASFNIKLQNRS